MGQLTGAVARAIPPPPDWDSVADKIGGATIRHLSGYIGSVPNAPSQSEIDQVTSVPMPKPDISTPEADTLKPEVPDEFKKGKISFDLNSVPAIETKDESRPFMFEDPISNIGADPPGQMVLPGDDRNSSQGIKEPDRVNTGEPPKPGKIVFELPRQPGPEPSKQEPPKPGNIEFELPKPSNKGGSPAIPDATTGPIPIPK
ncbi:hypothetical protein QYF52_25635 [Paenibacillus polymyxa]|uniref:hypothetical protein n=1 Tax=Paenibacillus polymyxa TaxID=1406 RepID=UPI0025B6E1C7|nr:hypothetical protein [Paenibacillus polymyxa]MDN4081311.1 hypothetical protein [Paenibacillus polymyxa]MDN4116953.1 hypothetical protein [Paenibacillus polymyxa]